jgi:O-antigen/teichoic acid export membrane protein
LLLLIHAEDAGPYWICRAVGGAYGTAVVIGILCVLGAAGREVRRRRPRFAFGAFYRYGFPVLLGTSLYLVMEWADILLLGHFAAADKVGVYRACVQICAVFDMIMFATNLAAVHVFPVLEHERRLEERDQAFRQVTLIVLMLSAPVFFLLTLHANAVLALLGPKFAIGAAALLILAAGRLLRNGLGTAAFVLILSGRQTVETRNAAVASATNLALNLALIPLFGLIGAAVATMAAEVALNLLRAWQVRRLMQIHVPWWLLLRIALVGCGATLLSALAHRTLGSYQASPLGLSVAVGLDGILLLVALWSFGIEREDRRFLKGALP